MWSVPAAVLNKVRYSYLCGQFRKMCLEIVFRQGGLARKFRLVQANPFFSFFVGVAQAKTEVEKWSVAWFDLGDYELKKVVDLCD